MSIETSPKWVQEQVRNGLNIDKKIDIRTSIDTLSKETLIAFFTKNSDTKFTKEGPENSAAHIIAYQKSLNLLGIPVDMDGWLGPKTINAIKTFQIKYQLKGKNGIPGSETIGALKDALQNSLPKEEIIKGKKEQEKTIQEKIDEFLTKEGYSKKEEGVYINTDNDLTLIIKNGKVEFTRSINRAFGNWELNGIEKRQISELDDLLKNK